VRQKPPGPHSYVLSVILGGKAMHYIIEKSTGVFLVRAPNKVSQR
jgi:hypothetical protein